MTDQPTPDLIAALRTALDACPHGPQYVAADFMEDGITFVERSAIYIAAACQGVPALLDRLEQMSAAPTSEEVQGYVNVLQEYAQAFPAATELPVLDMANCFVILSRRNAELDRQLAEAQEAARKNAEDAERYRWLRTVPKDGIVLTAEDGEKYGFGESELDETIDRCIAAASSAEHGGEHG